MLSLGVASFVLVGTACGGKEAKEAESLAKEACACTDNACAKGAFVKFEKWIAKNKKKKVSKKNAKKVGEASKKITECLMKQGIKPGEIMKALRAATK
jgi:hypothetical protein